MLCNHSCHEKGSVAKLNAPAIQLPLQHCRKQGARGQVCSLRAAVLRGNPVWTGHGGVPCLLAEIAGLHKHMHFSLVLARSLPMIALRIRDGTPEHEHVYNLNRRNPLGMYVLGVSWLYAGHWLSAW